jgi:acetyl esterase/lipase
MLITVGSWEVLESDAQIVAAKTEDAGGDVTLIVAEGMYHVYPVMTPFTREGKEAWAAFRVFIDAVM